MGCFDIFGKLRDVFLCWEFCERVLEVKGLPMRCFQLFSESGRKLWFRVSVHVLVGTF